MREAENILYIGWQIRPLMRAQMCTGECQPRILHHLYFTTGSEDTPAVTPVKRDAQAKIARLIMADGSASKAITPTLQ
jgi:hypothetical protein